MDWEFKSRLERVFRDFDKKYKIKPVVIEENYEKYSVSGGTETYTVELKFDNKGRLSKKTCTCPDYQGKTHHLCKHIIGTLYKTDREFMLSDKLLNLMNK